MRQLYLSHCEVQDLAPLVDMAKLEKFEVVNNPALQTLGALRGLTTLQELSLSYSGDRAQGWDLSPLSPLTALKLLKLGNTPTGDISPLKPLVNLRELNLEQTAVEDASALAGMTQLNKLRLAHTGVLDLSFARALTALEELTLGSAHPPKGSALLPVTDLAPLAGLVRLEKLFVQGHRRVPGVAPLKSLKSLKELIIHDCEIEAWPPGSPAESVVLLSLNGSRLPSDDLSMISHLSDLETLYLYQTEPVTDLTPLQELKALERLDIRETGITDLSPLQPLIDGGLRVMQSPQ